MPLYHILYLLMLISNTINFLDGLTVVPWIEVSDEFFFCSDTVQANQLVAFDRCDHLENREQNQKQFNFEKIWTDKMVGDSNNFNPKLISRDIHQVYGLGYECKKTIQQIITYRHLFGSEKIVQENEITLILTRAECLAMVESKRCDNYQMSCETSQDLEIHNQSTLQRDGMSCIFKKKIELSYTWLTNLKFEQAHCSFKQILVYAKKEKDQIFNSGCKANDLYCKTSNSVIVWNQNIISKCPYSHVFNMNNFSIGIGKRGDNVIIDKQINAAYKVTHKVIDCGTDMYATSNGLFVLFNNSVIIHKTSEIQIQLNTELLLAEDDGRRYLDQLQEFELLSKIECEQNVNTLKIFASNNQNKFFVIKEPSKRNNIQIYYANNGILYLPTCIPINTINITIPNTNDATDCIRFFIVSILHSKFNKEKRFILETNNVLRPQLQLNDNSICHNTKSMYFGSSQQLITITNKALYVDHIIKPNRIKDWNVRSSGVNFAHYSKLTEEIDLTNQRVFISEDSLIYQDQLHIFENQNKKTNVLDGPIKATTIMESFTTQLSYFGNFLLEKLWVILVSILSIITIIFVVYQLIKIILKKFLKKNRTTI